MLSNFVGGKVNRVAKHLEKARLRCIKHPQETLCMLVGRCKALLCYGPPGVYNGAITKLCCLETAAGYGGKGESSNGCTV